MAKAKAKTKSKKSGRKPKPEGEKRARAAVIPAEAVIRFAKNSETGEAYGPKNNPTRKGSKVFDRFAKYKDGMTVEKAVAAGVRRSDIPYHVAHGFITLELPAA